ncbi:unnamed protein product, partial [Didymodactylos carnosus]
PASDNYVAHKLKSRIPLEKTLKLEHRLQLAKLAIQHGEFEWIAKSPFSSELLTRHYGSAYELGTRLQNMLTEDHKVEILIIAGGDRIVNKQGIAKWRKSPSSINAKTVCIQRQNDIRTTTTVKTLVEIWNEDLKLGLIQSPDRYLIINTPVAPVSSTLVRFYMNRWHASTNESEKEEIEHEIVTEKRLLNFDVMKYLKDHENDLYLPPEIK